MSVYVGLDCGGSSTRILAIDHHGDVLFQGQSGAANLASTPEPRLRRHLASAARLCPKADFVCGCFAGLINPELRSMGVALLRELFPQAVVRAEPDYLAAFYSCPAETDLCVIAGTGSLVCSLFENQVVRSGGRGYLLGDEGSGFWYGRDAIRNYLDDPSQADHAILDTLREVCGTTEPTEIIACLYRSPTPAAVLGRFAKVLGHDAKAGRAYALASIDVHTANLSSVIARHIRQYHPDQSRLNLCLVGGVWKAAPTFGETLERHLRDRLPGRQFAVARVQRPPLHGAVELARQIEHGN